MSPGAATRTSSRPSTMMDSDAWESLCGCYHQTLVTMVGQVQDTVLSLSVAPFLGCRVSSHACDAIGHLRGTLLKSPDLALGQMCPLRVSALRTPADGSPRTLRTPFPLTDPVGLCLVTFFP